MPILTGCPCCSEPPPDCCPCDTINVTYTLISGSGDCSGLEGTYSAPIVGGGDNTWTTTIAGGVSACLPSGSGCPDLNFAHTLTCSVSGTGASLSYSALIFTPGLPPPTPPLVDCEAEGVASGLSVTSCDPFMAEGTITFTTSDPSGGCCGCYNGCTYSILITEDCA